MTIKVSFLVFIMSRESQDTVRGWLNKNSLQLLVIMASVIITFTWVQARLSAVEAQANALDAKMAKYPAQEYFDLRFSNIELQLAEVKQDVKKLQGN